MRIKEAASATSTRHGRLAIIDLFKPIIMAMPQDESVFREECQKTPVSIVIVKPGTREERL